MRLLSVILALVLALPSLAVTALDSSVVIRVPDRGDAFSTGSGTIFFSNGTNSLLITAGHIFRDSASNKFIVNLHDGTQAEGTLLLWSDPQRPGQPDLAIASVNCGTKCYSPIYPGSITKGESVTRIGMFGVRVGVVNKLFRSDNRWTIEVMGTGIPGDSGGGVFNSKGELVGVISAGDDVSQFCAAPQEVQSYIRELSTRELQDSCRWVRDACGNVVRVCPNQRPPQNYYPSQPSPPLVPVQSPPAPAQPPQPTIDWKSYEQQQQSIAEQQKALHEQSEKSLIVLNEIKVAIQNQKGCECKPTDLTGVNLQLQAILGQVNNLQKPVEQTPVPAVEQHVVVVADHNSDYWQRLAADLAVARKTYSGIQDTTLPPFAVGVHPQAVIYRDRVPVRVVKGLYEVEALLSRLARGEAI